MKLTMTNGKEFTFYMENEEEFDRVNKKLHLATESKLIECLPTLSVKVRNIMSIEKFYEELEG